MTRPKRRLNGSTFKFDFQKFSFFFFGVTFLFYILESCLKLTKVQSNVSVEPFHNLSQLAISFCKPLYRIFDRDEFEWQACAHLSEQKCLQQAFGKGTHQLIRRLESEIEFYRMFDQHESFDQMANQTVSFLFNKCYCERILLPQHLKEIGFRLDFQEVDIYMHSRNRFPFMHDKRFTVGAPIVMLSTQNTLFLIYRIMNLWKLPFPYETDCRETHREVCLQKCTQLTQPNWNLFYTLQQPDVVFANSSIDQEKIFHFRCLRICDYDSCHENIVYPTKLQTRYYTMASHPYFLNIVFDRATLAIRMFPQIDWPTFVLYICSLLSSFYGLSFILMLVKVRSFAKQFVQSVANLTKTKNKCKFWVCFTVWQTSATDQCALHPKTRQNQTPTFRLSSRPTLHFPTGLGFVPNPQKKFSFQKIFWLGVVALTLGLGSTQLWAMSEKYFNYEEQIITRFALPQVYPPLSFSVCIDLFKTFPVYELCGFDLQEINAECVETVFRNLTIGRLVGLVDILPRLKEEESDGELVYIRSGEACLRFEKELKTSFDYFIRYLNQSHYAYEVTNKNIPSFMYLHSIGQVARLDAIPFFGFVFNYIIVKYRRLRAPYQSNCWDYSQFGFDSRQHCVEECLLIRFQRLHGNQTWPHQIVYADLSRLPLDGYFSSLRWNDQDPTHCQTKCSRPDCLEYQIFPCQENEYRYEQWIGKRI